MESVETGADVRYCKVGFFHPSFMESAVPGDDVGRCTHTRDSP
jgi:hypothetical protein